MEGGTEQQIPLKSSIFVFVRYREKKITREVASGLKLVRSLAAHTGERCELLRAFASGGEHGHSITEARQGDPERQPTTVVRTRDLIDLILAGLTGPLRTFSVLTQVNCSH